MSDARYKLLYEEAIRQLTAQERELEQLRTRASGLVAASSVATSFFGAGLLRKTSIGVSGWLAIALFVVVVLISGWVVAGTIRKWYVGFSPVVIHHGWMTDRQPPLSEEALHLNLAATIYRSSQINDSHLTKRRNAVAAAGCCLTLEILLWILNLM
ncbi:hypothetical protein ACWCXB_32535 [Streptomyces sp. NPDC001514]